MAKKRALLERERDCILAGLRLLMAWRGGHLVSHDPDLDDNQVLDIATNGGAFADPDQDFLDNLCCDLNGGDIRVDEELSLLEKVARAAVEPKKKRKKG